MLLQKRNNLILILFSIGFLIRLIFVIIYGNDIRYPDANLYLEFAQNIANKGIYLAHHMNGLEIRAFRPPMYPLFIAIILKIFGNHIFFIRLFQIILSLIISFIIYKFTTLLINKKIGLYALIFSLIFPSFIFYSAPILTEMLFATSFVIGIYFLHLFQTNNKNYYGLLSALFFVISTLTKSLIFIFPIYLVILSLIFNIISFKKIIYVTLFFYLLMLPWAVRNYIVLGKLYPVSTEGGISLYWENHTGAKAGEGYAHPKNFDIEKFNKMSELERNKYYVSLAKKFIFSHPFEFTKLCFARAYQFLKFLPNKNLILKFGRYNFLIRIVYFIFYFPIFIGFLGMFFFKKVKKEFWLFSFTFLYFMIVYSIIAGKTRYRMPVEPFLIISMFMFLDKINLFKSRKL